MASVFDVADYILRRLKRPLTTMKLQKLVYYSQAWSLVWDEAPIFPERIEAWANGPVVPTLFNAHRGEFMINREDRGDGANLTKDERETVDAILDTYGDKSAAWLSDLSHREAPWKAARVGMGDGERGNVEITLGVMADYYGNL